MSLEKENFNDIGTPLDFCQGNHNQNDDVAATLMAGRKTGVENTTL